MTAGGILDQAVPVGIGDTIQWGQVGKELNGTIRAFDDTTITVQTADGQKVIPRTAYRMKVIATAAESAGEEADAAPAEDAVEDLFGGELDPEPALSSPRGIISLPVSVIAPFTHQVRRVFNEDKLRNLGESIRTNGQRDAIQVRPASRQAKLDHPNAEYELIAGERRWRACRLVGLETIQAVVREDLADDNAAIAESIRENTEREQLSAREEALAIQVLQGRNFTQGQIGEILSHDSVRRSQEWVSKRLALLRLPGEAQGMLDDRRLSTSQAEELLPLTRVAHNDAPKKLVTLARQAVEECLSTRVLGKLVSTERERLEAATRLPLDVPPAPSPITTTTTTTTTERTTVTSTPAPVQPATAQTATPDSESEAPTTQTPEHPSGSAPVRTAAEIAADRAAAATGKPGALKTAEERVAEKAGVTAPTAPPKPEGWEGKPVSTIIPATIYGRLEKLEGSVIPAVRTWCELAEIAQEHELEPSTGLELLKRFLVCCERMSTAPDSVLEEWEARVPGAEEGGAEDA